MAFAVGEPTLRERNQRTARKPISTGNRNALMPSNCRIKSALQEPSTPIQL